MLTDNFKILILSDKKLSDCNLLYKCKNNYIWHSIVKTEVFYSYKLTPHNNIYNIKSIIKQLFEFLYEEKQFNKKIYLIYYDDFEVVNDIEEKNYTTIDVTDETMYYDCVYRVEATTLPQMLVYVFCIENDVI